MAFDWRSRAGIRVSYGEGATPTKQWFERGRSLWQGDGVHDNPRFFKISWRIWTPANALPSGLYGDERRLAIESVSSVCFAEAMKTLQHLQASRIVFMAITRARKRISPEAPWDVSRLPLDRQALSYDEDTDPAFHGHR